MIELERERVSEAGSCQACDTIPDVLERVQHRERAEVNVLTIQPRPQARPSAVYGLRLCDEHLQEFFDAADAAFDEWDPC